MTTEEAEQWYDNDPDAQAVCDFLECNIFIDELSPRALIMLKNMMETPRDISNK